MKPLVISIGISLICLLLYFSKIDETNNSEKINVDSQPRSVTENGVKCRDLLTIGHWKNFKKMGFERIVNNQTITNVYDKRYPKVFPPFNIWPQQNYSGTWGGRQNCELRNFTRDELAQCFSKTQIWFFGDS